MNTQTQFKAGHTRMYIATREFLLGSSGVGVPRGGEVEFDGTSVSYAGLAPVVMPQLRGAIRAGWLVPADQYDEFTPEARPVSAGMTMRSAEGGNPLNPPHRREVSTSVEEEERSVGNIEAHASATRDRNRDNYRRPRRRTSRDESTAGERFHGTSVEAQDGVPVPGVVFQTKAGEEAKRSSTDMTRAGAAISQANKVKIKPGRGRTREELIRDAIARGGLTDDELAEYQQELASSRAVHGLLDPPELQVVGRVSAPQVRQTEGFTVTGSVGGGTAIADMGGTGGASQDQVSVVEQEGIRFTNTNVGNINKPKGLQIVAKAEVSRPAEPEVQQEDATCRRIAKAICKDFPDDYRFDLPEKKRMARLQADYEDRHDVIRAVAAAETSASFRNRLIEEFPGAF